MGLISRIEADLSLSGRRRNFVADNTGVHQKLSAGGTLSKAGKPEDTDGPVREANCEDCLKRVRRGSG